MNRKERQHFYKIYFGRTKLVPEMQVYIYYRGVPLYMPAKFLNDRYVFSLPVNLETKMLAGELIADFSYDEFPNDFGALARSAGAPTCILLSDRYG